MASWSDRERQKWTSPRMFVLQHRRNAWHIQCQWRHDHWRDATSRDATSRHATSRTRTSGAKLTWIFVHRSLLHSTPDSTLESNIEIKRPQTLFKNSYLHHQNKITMSGSKNIILVKSQPTVFEVKFTTKTLSKIFALRPSLLTSICAVCVKLTFLRVFLGGWQCVCCCAGRLSAWNLGR